MSMLSTRLIWQKKYLEAEEMSREAIHIKPNYERAYSSLGNALDHAGKYAEGEAAYREAIRLQPDNGLAHFNLGVALGLQNKSKEAEAEYREAIRLKPDFDGTYVNLGDILMRQGRFDEAEAAEREAIGLNPDPLPYIKLGYVLIKQSRFVDAEAANREAIRLDPLASDAHSNLAVALGGQGKRAEAETAAREAIRLNPSESGAHLGLAIDLEMQGKHAEAQTAAREAIRLAPDRMAGYLLLATASFQQNRYAEAVVAYRDAIRLQPNEAPLHSRLGEVLVKQAEATGGTPNWDDAAAAYVQAIDLSKGAPNGDDQHQFRALAKHDELFDQVAKQRPDNPKLWLGRAQNRAFRGRWAEAAADYAKVVHDLPLTSNVSTDYAYLLLLLNDTAGYQNYCKELIRRAGETNDVQVGYRLARVCGAAECDAVEPARLIEWASAAAKEKPDAWYPHVLGLVQYRAGQYEAAIDNLKKSNTIDWNLSQHQVPKAQNWLVLAMAHQRLGHADEARKCLETAKTLIAEVHPENPEDPIELDVCDWLPIQVFLHEAEALLQEPMPDAKTPKETN